METIQDLFYVLGVIALVLFITILAGIILLMVFIKKRVDRMGEKVDMVGSDLSFILYQGRKYLGILGSGGILLKILSRIFRRRH